MAFDFPNSPTNGQQITGPGGVIFTWDGTKWVTGTGGGNVAFAPLNNPILVGDPRAPTAPMGDADTSIATTAFVTPAYANVGRNLLHNGLFNIAQRGGGPWTATGYMADRWATYINLDTTSYTIVSVPLATSTAIDESMRYALQTVFTGSSSAGAVTLLYHKVEQLARLSGKTVTLSFYAWATSGSPKLAVGWQQNFGTGGSPSATTSGQPSPPATASLTTTPTRYSFTFSLPSIVGKTLGTNSNDATEIDIYYSQQAATVGIGVQSGSVQLWGIQLEIGAVATPLEKLDPQVDLANCQRFYQVGQAVFGGYSAAAINAIGTVTLPVAMRASPTIALTNNADLSLTSPTQAYVPGAIYFSGTTPAGASGWGMNRSYTASADL